MSNEIDEETYARTIRPTALDPNARDGLLGLAAGTTAASAAATTFVGARGASALDGGGTDAEDVVVDDAAPGNGNAGRALAGAGFGKTSGRLRAGAGI